LLPENSEILKPDTETAIAKDLNPKSKYLAQKLLFFEEAQMERDIRCFDMHGTNLKPVPGNVQTSLFACLVTPQDALLPSKPKQSSRNARC
jgi:hypothetical protein